MDARLHQAVRACARQRCEYCRFPEILAEVPFHLDHIVAQQHGGGAVLENLALACCFCNRFKGPNLSGMDPITGQVVRLFNPRQDRWEDHFAWNAALLSGLTATARATIQTLRLNRADAVGVRQLLMREGVYPAA